MDLKINFQKYLENDNLKIDNITFQKMIFIFNALDEGWSVNKKNNSYIFKKKHEGKKEILDDSYLLNFIKDKLDMNKIIS